MPKLVRYARHVAVLMSTLLASGCERSLSDPEFDATPVASLELVGVAPGIAPAIRVGETYQFSVVAKDSSGNIVTRPRLEWALYPMAPTVDLGEAALDTGGRMTGIERGWVTLRVSAAGGGVATTGVYIRNAVTSVRFSVDSIRLINGDLWQVSASAFDAVGEIVPYGVKPRWAAANPLVATVDNLGAIRSVGAGRTYIRVVAGERIDSVALDVRTVRYRGISPGSGHTCGITTTYEAVCYGSNLYGQLGFFSGTERAGSAGQYSQMAPGGPRVVAGGTGMAAVGSGQQHTCSLALDGAAYCWGDYMMIGGPARLTTCTFSLSSQPCVLEATRVAGSYSWASFEAGSSHSCGVTADRKALCWGRNDGGQLGDGGFTHAPSAPVPVAGNITWHSISAGGHTCGLSTDGTASCWGANRTGNLGTGGRDSSTMPAAVAGGHRFTAVAAGNGASCGVSTLAKVHCWGTASFLGSTTPPPDMCPQPFGQPVPCALQPVAVILPNDVVMLTMGPSLACAVTVAGAAYCWGPSVPLPTRVQGIPALRSIQAGGARACGIADDDIAYCWGTDLTPSLAAGQR